jgi:hypothetical protein
MSKKHRRASGNFQSVSNTATVPTQTVFRTSNPNDFNPDYSFVIKDLRKIGILAATFITILVILSFILK